MGSSAKRASSHGRGSAPSAACTATGGASPRAPARWRRANDPPAGAAFPAPSAPPAAIPIGHHACGREDARMPAQRRQQLLVDEQAPVIERHHGDARLRRQRLSATPIQLPKLAVADGVCSPSSYRPPGSFPAPTLRVRASVRSGVRPARMKSAHRETPDPNRPGTGSSRSLPLAGGLPAAATTRIRAGERWSIAASMNSASSVR